MIGAATSGSNWAEITFGAITSIAVVVTAAVVVDRWIKERKSSRSARLVVTCERVGGRSAHRITIENRGASAALDLTAELARINEKGVPVMTGEKGPSQTFPTTLLPETSVAFDVPLLSQMELYVVVDWRDAAGKHNRMLPLRVPLVP